MFPLLRAKILTCIILHLFHSDIIQGVAPAKSIKLLADERAEIVFSKADNRSNDSLLIGINARDRSGLLLDISKSLLQLDLQVHRTEAAVIDGRSISVWRCIYVDILCSKA